MENGFEIMHNLIKLKWVPEILESISSGNVRYNELLQNIQGISHTELNRKLTMLGEREAVSKKVNGSNASYHLMPFGEELIHIFNHLKELDD